MKPTPQFFAFASLVLLLMIGAETFAQAPFWNSVDGPYSGSLWAMRVMSDGTYYAGTGDGRVLRKRKEDEHWRLVATTPENQTILSFNEYEGRVYVGDANGSVLVSEDNGDSWISASAGITGVATQIRSMLVTPFGFLLGTGTGIYRQIVDPNKGGIAWQKTSFDTPRGNFVFSLAMDHDGKLYAGTGAGIYSSADNGQTWTTMGFDITATSVLSIDVNDGDVYIGTSRGIYVHYEGAGQNEWTTLAKDITKESFGVRSVKVIDNRVFMSVTALGTYYSDDNVNWTQLPYSDARAGFYADEDKLIVGTLDGVWSSSLDNPLSDVQKVGAPESITMLMNFQSRIMSVARYGVLYETTSPRDDQNWNIRFRIHSEGSIQCYTEKSDGTRYINLTGAATGVPLFGFTRTAQQNGYDAIPFPSEVRKINQYYVNQKDSVLIACDAGLYHFNTYTSEIKRLSKVTLLGKEILSLEEDIAGNLYALTPDGFYVSYDDGKTWPVNKLIGNRITDLLLTGEKMGFAGTDKGLYYFDDLQSDPVAVDGFGTIHSMAQDGMGHLYMISDKTVYFAESKEDRWREKSEEISGIIPRKLVVVDNYVYLSTDGGLYKHKYAEYAPVSLSGLGEFEYDGLEKPVIATTEPAGLAVDITFNKVHTTPLNSGRYKVRARVVDDVYVGEAIGEVIIGGMPAEVAIQTPGNFIYDGNPHGATASTSPSQLNVVITYNDELTVPVNAGFYVVKATISTPNWAGYKYDTIIIDKAQQIISFESLPDRMDADAPFSLSASSSVGLPVHFNIAEGPAVVDGNLLTLSGEPGRVVVNAVQDGNENYYSANTVTRKFNVWNDLIMGTEDPNEKVFSAYPVPAKDVVNILAKERLRSIKLYDPAGREVKQISPSTSDDRSQMSTAELKPGLYLLQVQTEKGERATKQIQIVR